MRNRKLAITLAFGALAAGCYAGYRRNLARAARPASQPDYLQTWEGEGGGVPTDSHHTAAQIAAQADGSPSSVRDSSELDTAALTPR